MQCNWFCWGNIAIFSVNVVAAGIGESEYKSIEFYDGDHFLTLQLYRIFIYNISFCLYIFFQDGRSVSRIWVIGHVIIMFAVGGAFLCIITNELEINDAITALLIVTGIDFLLLIPFSWLIFMYSTEDEPYDTYV